MDDERMYQLCPLNPQMFRSEQPMEMEHLKEIEEHVKSNRTDCPHLPLKYLVFHDNSPIKGSTPLLMACFYGELASVKRIVEYWGVDVNLPSIYYFDPFQNVFNDNSIFIKIEKATPLFVSANMGHLDIVQYLVDHAGADVFAKTANEANADYDGLTPLYGAVTHYSVLRKKPPAEERSATVRYLLESGADPSIDTIRHSDGNPMWTNSLCGIEAITALIEHGMNVNQRYPNLDEVSLLNYSITEKSLAVVELLMSKGADLHIQDSWGLTPIFKAACYSKWDVFDFLLERNELRRTEKIEALELVGASILCTYGNYYIPKAIGYWRQSLHLRSMNTDGCGPIIKTSQKNPENDLLVEWTTLEDLEDVVQHRYKQEIQSYLVLRARGSFPPRVGKSSKLFIKSTFSKDFTEVN